MSYKLIALDLDGTLLDSQKRLSEKNRRVLCDLADKGIIVVPTTGRFYDALPVPIKSLPFLRYFIAINGALVEDLETEKKIYQCEIPLDDALALMRLLDEYPVIYDCYMDSKAYITEEMYDQVGDFVSGADLTKLVKNLRHTVKDLKSYVTERNDDVQKIQLYTKDDELRDSLYGIVGSHFPDILCTSSRECNIEFNQKGADKGSAIKALADYLGMDMSEVITFGDATNDLTMIAEAGMGIAMGNAVPEVIEASNYVTDSCDEDGVANALIKLFELDESLYQ